MKPTAIFTLLMTTALCVPAALGANTGTNTPTKPKTATARPVAPIRQLKARTPFERIMLPQIQKRVAAAAAARAKAGARPDTIPSPSYDGLTVPNFGGYINAPSVPARSQATCIADPYNCGVDDVVLADFDKDGKTDAAVIQADGNLDILLNSGSGFSPLVPYTNPNYSSTQILSGSTAAVDLNGDGYADLIALDALNNALVIWINLKNGTFAVPTSIPLDSDYGYIEAIAIGDVNGDGKLDVVTATTDGNYPTSSQTVQTLLGNGDGTFQQPTTALTQFFPLGGGPQLYPKAIALGDLNGDGKLDIALEILQGEGHILVTTALGVGDGSFAPLNVTVPISVDTPTFPFGVTTSAGVQMLDLNNDKKLDVAADTSGVLNVALGDGTGAFTSVALTQGESYPSQIIYLDVNGDGIPDIVQSDGNLNVWIGIGDGTFSHPGIGSFYVEDQDGPGALAAGDITGDGITDIVSLGGDYKQLSLYAGTGKGAFYGAPMLVSPLDPYLSPIDLGLQVAIDVQGKGYLNPIFTDYDGDIVTGLNDGKGNFTYTVALAAAAIPTYEFVEPVQADFNGDGKQDLLIADYDGTMSIALSNGDGTFATPVALAIPALNCPLGYASTGDLNKDGNTDIVIAYVGDAACGGAGITPSGYFTVLGTGPGTFGAPTFTPYGTELYSVAIGDLNSDGFPDLVINDEPFQVGGTWAVDLLLGNGDGTFTAGNTVYSNQLVSQVALADYNGDGKLDIVLFSEGDAIATAGGEYFTTAGILLMPGNGDGTFSASTQLGTGSFFLNGAVADVNNDGIVDIEAALYSTYGQPQSIYGLATFIGEGGGSFSTPTNTLESLNSNAVFVGNINSDNAPDVMVDTGYGPVMFTGAGGTTFTLTASGSSITFGQTETLTVAVAASLAGRPSPTGAVSLYDGSALLSTVTLSGGSGTFTSNSLAAGTHTITAVYTGDTSFNPATSTAATVVVAALAPGITLTANPTTLSITRGQSGIATLTLTANASYSGSVTLTCTGAPADGTCAVNPGTVTLTTGSSTTISLLVGTTTSASNQPPAKPLGTKVPGGIAFAGLLALLMVRRRKSKLLPILGILLLVIPAALVSGCSTASSVKTASKGSYTLTVTATPTGSAATVQTATVTVTVQ